MEANKLVKEKHVKKEGSEEVDEDDHLAGCSEDDKKKKAGAGAGAGRKAAAVMRCCQAEKCTADLTEAKQYHRRHKVCEHHAKAQVVVVAGIRQRFCQQCSRFHELSEFDEAKRSCRRRLAGHNERRRKNTGDHAEGSGRKATHLKEIACGQVDDHHRGRIQISIQDNNATNYKHFQIRS